MNPTRVAIIGLGTVGTGVARLLLEQPERIAKHAGRPLVLARVVTRQPSKDRGLQLPPGLLTDDVQTVLHDKSIETVALLIGGIEPERSLFLQLLESGKNVVTANKALLAECGPQLFDRARALGRSIAFEAAVAGGIPIIAAIGQSFTANRIERIHGILNGTSNFILTAMEERGWGYSQTLAEAQALGYAEADPTLDIDGTDAAQKLAILAHLAFGARINWRQIPRRGINTLHSADFKFAHELGYRIKLLAVAERVAEGLELHVSPTFVKVGTPMAEVRGANNAISVLGDAVGSAFFHGPGAGQMPTASAVVADLIDTALGRAAITFRTLDLWSPACPVIEPREFGVVPGRFYLRFHVQDEPNVLAQIAGALGRHGVSIASVIQHEQSNGTPGMVPLVIMTHNTTEGATRAASEEIDTMGCSRPPCERLRVSG